MQHAIYFLCPDNPLPCGGIKQIYRQVDVLNAHGFEAAVVHGKPGFRCSWFENSTRVSCAAELRRRNSIAVIPEMLGPQSAQQVSLAVPNRIVQRINSMLPQWVLRTKIIDLRGIPKVVFCQNAYLNYLGYGLDDALRPHHLRHPEVRAVLTLSDDNAECLAYSFPGLPLLRVRNGIDTSVFEYSDSKEPLIAFMSRKNKQHALQVIGALHNRGALADYQLIDIDGCSERQTACALRRSAFFLSFGDREGLPLPPLEAMASGCVVIGYDGRGGREYFLPEFSIPVAAGDIPGFARAVERSIAERRTDPLRFAEMGRKAAAFVNEHYNRQVESRMILDAWRSILEQLNNS